MAAPALCLPASCQAPQHDCHRPMSETLSPLQLCLLSALVIVFCRGIRKVTKILYNVKSHLIFLNLLFSLKEETMESKKETNTPPMCL